MLTRFSMLFHLTLSIINKQGKMWLSLSLLDGLADTWKIFDIISVVSGMRDGSHQIPTLFHGVLIWSSSLLCKLVVFNRCIFLILITDTRIFLLQYGFIHLIKMGEFPLNFFSYRDIQGPIQCVVIIVKIIHVECLWQCST